MAKSKVNLERGNVPILLESAIKQEKVGLGAMLKSLTDDRRAVVVDVNHNIDSIIAVKAKDKFYDETIKSERECLPASLKDYVFFIPEPAEWLITEYGSESTNFLID